MKDPPVSHLSLPCPGQLCPERLYLILTSKTAHCIPGAPPAFRQRKEPTFPGSLSDTDKHRSREHRALFLHYQHRAPKLENWFTKFRANASPSLPSLGSAALPLYESHRVPNRRPAPGAPPDSTHLHPDTHRSVPPPHSRAPPPRAGRSVRKSQSAPAGRGEAGRGRTWLRATGSRAPQGNRPPTAPSVRARCGAVAGVTRYALGRYCSRAK